MTTIVGNSGKVKIGSVYSAEVMEFSLEISAQMVEDSELTDAWNTFKAGSKGWKGSVTVAFDPTDSSGQEAMSEGATITLGLYPAGSGAGAAYYSGSAVIESRGLDVKRNGVITRQISFQGSGALAQSTV